MTALLRNPQFGSQTNAQNNITSFTYDAVGNLLSVTDARSNKTSFTQSRDLIRLRALGIRKPISTRVTHPETGIRTVKVLPTPNSLSASMVPPSASRMDLQIDKPSPA